MATIEEKNKIKNLLEDFSSDKSQVIHALQTLQNEFGYVPEVGLKVMAEVLEVPLAKIYGVASFYKQIHLNPRGKKIIKVCTGTACHVRGAALIEDEFQRKLEILSGETTPDLKYTLEAVNCVGACGMAPVVVIDEQYYGSVQPDRAVKLLNKSKGNK